MDPSNAELDLEDLPSQWLSQCDAHGEDEEQELSLDSLCDGGADYIMQSILLDSSNTIPHISPSFDEIEHLPFDCSPIFLHDMHTHSPNFSGDLDDSPKLSGDLCVVSDDFDLDFLATNHPSNILELENHEETFPSNEVVKSSNFSNKRACSHSITSNFQNKRTQISSPMSVLDQVHCVDGNSPKFSICLLQAKNQDLHEPLSKTSSPRKHSKKGSTSHSNAHLSKESKWAQQLLKACAFAIANNNISRTQHLMWVLNDLASFTGDANQRLAACGLKALFSRVTGEPPSLHYASDSNSNLTAASLHRALLKFQDASPWHKCTYTIANGAIVEACEGHEIIHVVDIGVSQGTQWPTLIEALATRASGVPKLLKLTMVENELGSASFISRLELFAKRLGLNLKLKSIAKPLESLISKDFELEQEEELIVCVQFRLHHLTQELNEEACTSSKRDKFLELIHSLKPNTFILSDNDVDHCSLDFLTRFQKAMEFQWSFLDSTSSCFQGQDSEERQIMEAEATLAFTNIIAFEDNTRTERNETHTSWSSRVQKCGFSSYLPGAQVLESAKSLLRKHSGDWNMLVEDGIMALRWKGNPTTFCSLWKPFSSK